MTAADDPPRPVRLPVSRRLSRKLSRKPSSTLARTLARVARVVAVGFAAGVVGGVVGVGVFVCWPLDEDALLSGGSSLQVLARDGTVLAVGLDDDGGRSLPLDEVPPAVAAAFVAVEDRRFFEHGGIDGRGVVRAVKDSVAAGHVVSGASTITQQLARLLGKRGPGVAGKVEEALWALRLEAHVDKDRLLRAYLDRVPLGRNNHGVGAAARVFFDSAPSRLTTSQAALLAGMAHAPELEDPLKHPTRARARRDEVLRRLHEQGAIDGDVLARALADDVDVRLHQPEMLAPHLTSRLRHARPQGASVVQTTLDVGLQREVEAIVTDEVLFGPHRDDGLQHAAVVVVDNRSGEVLSWVGSASFFSDATLGQNDGVTSPRQPGSALKPFVYGRALQAQTEAGKQALRLTAATILSDVDTDLAVPGPGADGAIYRPQNYDRRMHGPVTLRAALQNSYNVPAIEVARRLGPAAVLDVLQRAGFASLDQPASHYGVGLVLGNGEVTLLELATGYAGLARGGRSRPLTVVAGAYDEKRNSVPIIWGGPAGATETRFLDDDSVALLTHILKDDAARAPAFGLDNALDLEFPVAAKTGTSRSYVDNWTAGFTVERTVAVWAGSFDGTPMRGVSGISGAGVVFRRVMEAAMRGIEPAALVDERRFDHARVCPLSGLLATDACPAIDEVFLPGTAPATTCTVHRSHGQDGAHVDPGCAAGERPVSLSGALGAWAAREGRCQTSGADPAARASATTTSATGARGFLTPRDGDVYALERGLPADDDGQAISLRCTPDVVRVVVDGVDHVPGGWLSLGRGAHTLQAVGSDGVVVDEARITVR